MNLKIQICVIVFVRTNTIQLKYFVLLQTKLSCDSMRGTSLPPSLQVLITLRFLACGTFQSETVDLCGVSESTVCKTVHKVYKTVCELIEDYIKFPDFCEYGNFPGVIGCIDGCHISIKCPSTEDAELYRNRKHWFSINVQGVCTPTMQFSSIVALWKGSTHDSGIFQNSSLCIQFEAGQHSGILLGDIRAHIHTRGLVERMFSIWKNCFHCLRNTSHFEPRRCCNFIVQNYLRQHGCSDAPTEYCNDPHEVRFQSLLRMPLLHCFFT
uniref:DDE Tnp4 domain-containing protein n=1 Tax=Amphiprion ocellaris TaxID=80972 RepID=A0AAQ5YMF8_AMPOC